jgi:hypothetical protein
MTEEACSMLDSNEFNKNYTELEFANSAKKEKCYFNANHEN